MCSAHLDIRVDETRALVVQDDSNRWTEELETVEMEGNWLVQDDDSRADQQHIDEDESQPCEDHASEDETINSIENLSSRDDDLYEPGSLEEADIHEGLSGTNPSPGIEVLSSRVEVDGDGIVLGARDKDKAKGTVPFPQSITV